MKLNRITVQNFRNYDLQTVTFSPDVNLIYGQNAQGKTNLLEAIAASSTMRLFRTHQKKEGLQFGADQAKISALFETKNREIELVLHIFRDKTMEIYRNGIRQKRQSDAAGLLKSVLFCPDDLYLIRDGAAARRRFLDTALCQLRPKYVADLAQYQKLLEHKTRILRDYEEKPSLLDLLDDFSLQMAHIGAKIIRRRARFIQTIGKKAQEIHFNIAGQTEVLDMQYRTVSSVTDPLLERTALTEQLYAHALSHRHAEMGAHSCLSGPHKDDLELFINQQSAAAFGSQGQVRTCALALKLAEREVFFHDTGEYPLLLLDDVMSELDPQRQDFVLNRIQGGQVFITCCEDALRQRITNGTVFHVVKGKIENQSSNPQK